MSRLLITGPIFDTPSGPGGMGGELYKKLKSEGYLVFKRSRYRDKIRRFFDTLFFVVFSFWKYDVILIQCFAQRAFFLEYLVCFFGKSLRKKVIITLHGGAFLEYFGDNEKVCRKMLAMADAVSSPSLFIIEGLKNANIAVAYIPNYIDERKFPFKKSSPEPFSVLWIRAFTDIYRPEIAVAILEELVKSYPNAQLTMIGPDMGTKSKVLQVIDTAGLTQHINLVGYVNNDTLHQYYHSHSVYINTPMYESFGVAVIEAASCGIPIVSARVGEIPCIWQDGKNILLADGTQAKEYAAAIARIWEDNTLASSVVDNARQVASRFTWQEVKPLWINLISIL